METALVLGLLVVTVVMFAFERIPVDVITLLMLVALVITGILTPAEAFQGLSDEIVIVLASIFVLSGALQSSGLMDRAGARLQALAGRSERGLVLAIMGLASGISSFMNNTTTTAVLLPPVLGISKRTGVSASRLLMPLAYASMLGGACTLIGTSTNIAVSGYVSRVGLEPLTLFEVTPVGLAIVAIGILYMRFVGRRLLPDHKNEELAEAYALRNYLSEVVVVDGSPLIGQKVFHSDLSKLDIRVIYVLRGEQRFLPDARTTMEAGDVLLIEANPRELLKIKAANELMIRPDMKCDLDVPQADIKVAEMLVTPRSDLRGRTLKEADFRRHYDLTALAIYRAGHALRDKISSVRLRIGDLLLVQGSADRLENMRRHPDLWLLEELSPALYNPRRGLLTLALFVTAIGVGAFGVIPLSIALLGGALLAVLTRAVTAEESYEMIDWRLIILIGGMTAFGTAMEKSGAARFLATQVVHAFSGGGAHAVLGGFVVLTVLLTQPMSNAAAALVILPVATEAARAIGADERTFAIGIMLAASVSLITPFEPSCILVYGPGKYRFRDFIKVGGPLTLILVAVVLILVPLLWPLEAVRR